jgi:hypothetical protein
MVKSDPPWRSVWNLLAAYGLIKALGWIRREPLPAPAKAASLRADDSPASHREVSDHGLSGWWALFRDAALRWIDHKAARLGAALAYYSVFSIGPLMLIAIAVAGLFFGADAVRGQVSVHLSGLLGETGGKAVEAMLAGAAQRQEGSVACSTGSGFSRRPGKPANNRPTDDSRAYASRLPLAMPSRRFPKPGTVKRIPSGYRAIDANGMVLAHVYGQPDGAIAISDSRLTSDEARRISKLISRLPELVEVERDRNKARSRRKPQPLRFKPVTIGDLIRDGKLLEVHCGNWRPAGCAHCHQCGLRTVPGRAKTRSRPRRRTARSGGATPHLEESWPVLGSPILS